MKNLVASFIADSKIDASQGTYASYLEVCLMSVLIIVSSLKMETKFTHMIKGVAAVLLIKRLVELTNLTIFTLIIEKITNCGVIVCIMVFQPEIRDILQYLGKNIHWKKRRRVSSSLLISLEKALQYMAKRKIGALITIERLVNLQEFISTGTHLNADVTSELLINIFTPNTPLHDGAVIIRRGKIVAASSYIPLSDSRTLPSKFGTRHRAALGISEVSDSITLVVSEETGEISVAYDSKLINKVTLEMCLQIVKRELLWM